MSLRTDRIMNYLWQHLEGQESMKVYALVDAAGSESIYPKIMGAESKYVCLHRGKIAKELAWVAPYLIRLQHKDPFTRWLLDNCWGKCQCVFILSSSALNELKRHFRTFLTVYDEKGKSYFFRFYDPRVMRVYLSNCNESELDSIYGPIAHFCIEGKEQKTLVDYICTDEFELVENVVIL